jgi:hypothetical protein
MTLDPVFAASVRSSGLLALSHFSLTALEQDRLLAAAGQRGMSLNCTLARSNRFATILDAFPLTCTLLKSKLRALLDDLWHTRRPDNYQLAGEDLHFAAFLQAKLDAGELNEPYAAEILTFERVSWEMIQSLRLSANGQAKDPEHSRIVLFQHDPRVLLPALESDRLPPAGLAASAYRVRLTMHGDTLEIESDD